MTVEYAYLDFKGGDLLTSENTIAGLNKLGEDGWQLISRDCLSKIYEGSWSGLFMRVLNVCNR